MARSDPDIYFDYEFEDSEEYIEITVHKVPEDSKESGYKYSFQFCDRKSGATYLRYDNSDHYSHHPTDHHKHTGGRDTHIRFPDGGIKQHIEDFFKEIENCYGRSIPRP